MAGQGGASSGQDQSTSLDFLWAAVALVAAVLAIWFFGKNYIIKMVFMLKIIQLKIVSFFAPQAAAIEPYLQQYRNTPENMNFATFQFFMTEVGKYVSYPLAVLFIGLAAYLFFGNFSNRFTKVFNMDRLYDAEKKDWPQITPISKVDLIKEPINTGPWAMALSPMEFAKQHNLLREITETIYAAKVSERGVRVRVEVIRSKATAVFASQLGREWDSIENLPIYIRALFAAFAAKANQDRVGSKKLLDQISRSSEGGKLDFTGTDELLNKHKNHKEISKFLACHAYVTTVMASMLEYARTDGVFASSDFLWLKPVDRNLWYLLNSVGRQTPFAEVAGPFAHWLVENELQHRITTPMVEEAVNGLERAITDIIYSRDED